MTFERVDVIPTLPRRRPDSHKGQYGRVLVVAGSRGMAGAAALCGAAALRSGAGLVKIASAAEVQPTVASFEPSYMTYPLDCDGDGVIRFASSRLALERLIAEADVLAIGPGLGRSEDVERLVAWVVESVGCPTVIDADALTMLAGKTELLRTINRPVVVTPHPGEFARLTGRGAADVQADRANAAADFAQLSESLVVVLKGRGTVVAGGGRVYVNETGNPGMATGGSGDVLTGVIASLLGQRIPAFEAAQLGVYVHGLAGDVARDQNGEIGLIAGDIVDALADAWANLP